MTPITAHILPNRLLVLAYEMHSAPIATCWVWYRVGSRHERIGKTGISHWVEHMLFKGTPAVPAGTLKRLIARNGGLCNGFTANDYTAFFTTLPADRIDLALQLESDRMVNARFDPAEVAREGMVTLAEREGHENDPAWRLNEAVLAAAFQVHPYRNKVIGQKHDLQAITRDDLHYHYRTHYRPNNAVLVLVGDFNTETLMRTVEHYFAALPGGSAPPPIICEEPAQQAERRVVLRQPGPVQHIQVVYRAPSCRHPDFAPLLMLDAVLSGAKSPSFSNGAPTYQSARLYRALVETQLAPSARSHFPPSYDPRLFELRATIQDGHSIAEVEAALISEVDKIQQDGVSAMELMKALKQIRAQMAYAGERVTSQAWLLGMWEMLDSFTRKKTLLDELSAVSADDIRRVAQTYLAEHNRTVGQGVVVSLSREYGGCSGDEPAHPL